MNPTDPKPQPDLSIIDADVGLPLQFVLAAMISQGISEVVLTPSIMEQACDKVFKAYRDENGNFVITIMR
jgi:hypothetical protein